MEQCADRIARGRRGCGIDEIVTDAGSIELVTIISMLDLQSVANRFPPTSSKLTVRIE